MVLIFSGPSSLLNAMLEAYMITLNETHLDYALKFADALYFYGVNHTTNLPFPEVYIDGTISKTGWSGNKTYVFWAHARLIAALIKTYEVTKNVTYSNWALQITRSLWNFRDSKTNLLPLFISADGLIKASHCVFYLDPVQTALTYAYSVTKDREYLEIAVNLTDAELKYGWNDELGRMNGEAWLDGRVKDFSLDIDAGPQMFIIALMQLYQLTGIDRYKEYALKFWTTLHDKAKVNGLYVTKLSSYNAPSKISRIYCAQMMIQCDAYLYYYTKNPIYFYDMIDTIENFILYFNRTYGYVSVINIDTPNVGHYVSEGVVVDALNVDWLDTSSYTFGPVIYLMRYCKNTSLSVDPFYYMPYYPMLRVF